MKYSYTTMVGLTGRNAGLVVTHYHADSREQLVEMIERDCGQLRDEVRVDILSVPEDSEFSGSSFEAPCTHGRGTE